MADLVWPVLSKHITSGYDLKRMLPLGAGGRMIASPHAGVDLRAPLGSTVTSPVDGVIVEIVSTRKPGQSASSGDVLAPGRSGNGFRIRYGNRLVLLGHVRPFDRWHVGDRVTVGTPLGAIDLSGTITGPHLHMEDWADWTDHRSHTDFAPRLGDADPTPPPPEEEDDMPYTPDQLTQYAAEGVLRALSGTAAPAALRGIVTEGAWSASIGTGENRRTLATALANAESSAKAARAEVAALRDALAQVSTGQPVDYDRIAQIVRDNTPDRVEVDVTVTKKEN